MTGRPVPDLRELLRLLTRPLRGALERAVVRTVEGRRLQVEVEDLVVGVLGQADTDVAQLALRLPTFDAVGLVAAADATVRARPTGDARPTFSPALIVVLERALHCGQQIGWTRIRSAAVLWALVEDARDRLVDERVLRPLVSAFGADGRRIVAALPLQLAESLDDGSTGGAAPAGGGGEPEGDVPATWRAMEEHFERFGCTSTRVAERPRDPASPVHVRVHLCPPTPERPTIVAFTSGMSERPQLVPAELGQLRHVELVATLPATWPGLVQAGPPSDVRASWFLFWMQEIALFPHGRGAWVGPGHSFPTDHHPLPGARFEGFLLYVPMAVSPEVAGPSGRSIRLLSIVPLFGDELELKRAQGTDALVTRFEAAGLSEEELWDPNRRSFASPRGKWWKVWS